MRKETDDMAAAGSLQVDAFEMRLADIASVGIDRLHALSIAVGWPHRAEDWQLLREVGHGFVALDEIDRVLGSAMWFPHGPSFATIGMVITSPRLQTNGTGLWLMQHLFRACGSGLDFRLNATRAARRLYLSLDFVRERTVYQCQGTALPAGDPPPLPEGASLRPLTAGDLGAATALDARAFGVPRTHLLRRLQACSQGHGLFRADRLAAFALCRRFGRGHVVGPVVAASEADAIAVLAPHVRAHAGGFLRLDTPLKGGSFAAFLARSGLPVFDTVLTMSRGRRLLEHEAAAGGARTFALAAQALG